MKKNISVCTAAALCLLLTGCSGRKAPQPEIKDIAPAGENRLTCTFEGVKHDMILDMPENTENAPLVIMLHGYGSSAEAFRSDVRFEESANPLGYAVVYVTGAPNPTDRTSSNGWNSDINPDGNNDTGFLKALAEYLQDEYSLDKSRTYAAGFSNGAFMMHRLAMEADGTFSALVSVSGMMQENVWNSRSSSNNVSFFQITGSKDDVVPKNSDGTAKYTSAPPIEDVMTYWADSNGAVLTGEYDIGKSSVLKKYENPDTGKQVWDMLVKNGGHSWPDSSLCGFDTNGLILEFFGSLN